LAERGEPGMLNRSGYPVKRRLAQGECREIGRFAQVSYPAWTGAERYDPKGVTP
jgi:hypothetical protein